MPKDFFTEEQKQIILQAIKDAEKTHQVRYVSTLKIKFMGISSTGLLIFSAK
jgi:hypothetical protein